MPSVSTQRTTHSSFSSSSPATSVTNPVDVPSNGTLTQRSSFDSYGNSLSPFTCGWTEGYGNQSILSDSSEDLEEVDDILSLNNTDDTSHSCTYTPVEDLEDYEVLSFDQPIEHTLYIKEFPHTTPSEQNFLCSCCKKKMSPSNARRCYYYGDIYCKSCHLGNTTVIPAKIINNFDIRKYPVCRRAKYIIESNFHYPLFDIQNDNAELYTLSRRLFLVKSQRIQLKSLYNYLKTCSILEKSNALIEDCFLRDLWPKDHLYQSIHTYSLHDIVTLKKLHLTLNNTIINAKTHVLTCVLCSQKGYFCEICKNRKEILYPFDDLNFISCCHKCSAIYHNKCYQFVDKDCPKCYRCIARTEQRCAIDYDNN
ncbi:unnamed protein product [Didymodactylos carnosus]|nr:unnamed protein product [Didymodactylos carnosus]CAF3721306.1 unnamed protein product [Didymodactylos carnosus]